MIERKFVSEKLKELYVSEYVQENIKNAGFSHIKLQRTPLGEKIIIYAARPGFIVGRKGDNIKVLTNTMKNKFKLDNPQIEVSEVAHVNLDACIVAERVASALERFGSQKFKAIGHKAMTDVMNSGALGVEIVISGKTPSTRAKRWRFYQGYLKKSGDFVVEGVHCAYTSAQLKSGTLGIQVRIMTRDKRLPDNIQLRKEETVLPSSSTPDVSTPSPEQTSAPEKSHEGAKEKERKNPKRRKTHEEK